MAEPAPAAAASAQQEVVSPETTHATPAPAATSARQASTRPEAPAPTQANPVRASQAPPNLVGMRAATLYAEPVDPAKPTEDVGWKWVKLALVVIALLVALAALGLSLSILRFPKTLDLTRSYAIIASTVPLHAVVILWSTAELATRLSTKGKKGANPNAAVAMWVFIWIFAVGSIVAWSLISYFDDFEHYDSDPGYDNGYGGSSGGGNDNGYGGTSGGDYGDEYGGNSGSGYDGYDYGYQDDGFGSEGDSSNSNYMGSYGSGNDGFGFDDGDISGYDYASSLNTTVTNTARALLRRSVTAKQGKDLRTTVVAETSLNGVIALLAMIIFIGDCVAARRRNTTREPAPAKADPEQADSEEDADAPRTPPSSRGWVLAKHAVNACAVLISIIGAILSLLMLKFIPSDDSYYGYYSYYDLSSQFPPTAAVPLFTLVWIAAEYLTQFRRKFQAGIHPGAHVGIWVFIFSGSGIVAGVQMVFAAAMMDGCLYAPDEKPTGRDSYSGYGRDYYYYESDDCFPREKRLIAVAAASFACLHFLVSTFLFVAACADTHRRNSQAARTVLYVPVPYGQMQQYQVQPQSVLLQTGEQVMAYPALPPVARGTQPMVQQQQHQQHQMQMQQVGQPAAAGPSGPGPSAVQPSVGRQSQIVEYYGVAN